MKIAYMIKRYGTWEFRNIDIDLEDVVKNEVEDLASSCGGFDEDAINSVDIDYSATVQNLVREYL